MYKLAGVLSPGFPSHCNFVSNSSSWAFSACLSSHHLLPFIYKTLRFKDHGFYSRGFCVCVCAVVKSPLMFLLHVPTFSLEFAKVFSSTFFSLRSCHHVTSVGLEAAPWRDRLEREREKLAWSPALSCLSLQPRRKTSQKIFTATPAPATICSHVTDAEQEWVSWAQSPPRLDLWARLMVVRGLQLSQYFEADYFVVTDNGNTSFAALHYLLSQWKQHSVIHPGAPGLLSMGNAWHSAMLPIQCLAWCEQYSFPCDVPSPSFTMLPGQSCQLSALHPLPGPNPTWQAGLLPPDLLQTRSTTSA